MARPPQDDIDTFKAITGASDDVAVIKLEEHGGDLNAAINAHFSEADRLNALDYSQSNAWDDYMDIDSQVDTRARISHFPHLPADINPFSLLNPLLHPRHLGSRSSHSTAAPRIAHPREVREIPVEVRDGSSHSSQTGPLIEDVTDSVTEHGPTIQGSVIIDDDEEDNAIIHRGARDVRNNDFSFSPAPSAPVISDAIDIDPEIEEQMIMAAIEASKQEVSSSLEVISNTKDVVSPPSEAIVGGERAAHDKAVQFGQNVSSSSTAANLPRLGRTWKPNGRQEPGLLNDETSSRSRSEEGDAENSVEQPLTRRRSSRRRSATGNGPSVYRPSSRHVLHDDNHPQLNGDALSYEWGGISSEEHDEAVMLEAAMFGGVPESSTYPFAYHSQPLSERNTSFNAWVPRSPSPTLVAERILREQQDDEYLASLAADREKELKAMQEAEHRRSEEEAAKEAALELERCQKEEAERELLKQQEYERHIAAKQASLPREPASDDENAVTILVRMPDGNRQGRRFLKSEKLQCLFDFIDVGKVVKPSTYRLVRPYPRKAFGEGEKELSLSDLGLTSKQEALFLEMI